MLLGAPGYRVVPFLFGDSATWPNWPATLRECSFGPSAPTRRRCEVLEGPTSCPGHGTSLSAAQLAPRGWVLVSRRVRRATEEHPAASLVALRFRLAPPSQTCSFGVGNDAVWQHADDTAPVPERDAAAHATHRSTPLHARVDAFTRQLRRGEAQRPSEPSTGGWWAGHRGEWLTCYFSRMRASGEGRLLLASSRLILRLSRLKVASTAVSSEGCGCRAGSGWAERCDVDRWVPAARVPTSGEGRLLLASSRLILRLSRLMIAFLAVSSVRCGSRLVVGVRRPQLRDPNPNPNPDPNLSPNPNQGSSTCAERASPVPHRFGEVLWREPPHPPPPARLGRCLPPLFYLSASVEPSSPIPSTATLRTDCGK